MRTKALPPKRMSRVQGSVLPAAVGSDGSRAASHTHHLLHSREKPSLQTELDEGTTHGYAVLLAEQEGLGCGRGVPAGLAEESAKAKEAGGPARACYPRAQFVLLATSFLSVCASRVAVHVSLQLNDSSSRM